MAQATQAYHKRDLYSEVTGRILTELETALPHGSSLGPQLRGLIIPTMQHRADLIVAATSSCCGWHSNGKDGQSQGM